jgi:hypothetical protein
MPAFIDRRAVVNAYEKTARKLGHEGPVLIRRSFWAAIKQWASIVEQLATPPITQATPLENEGELVKALLVPGKPRWSRNRRGKTKRKRNVLECEAALYLAVLFHEYFHRVPTHGAFKDFGKAVFAAVRFNGLSLPAANALREAIERWETSYHFDKDAMRRHLFRHPRKGALLVWHERPVRKRSVGGVSQRKIAKSPAK